MTKSLSCTQVPEMRVVKIPCVVILTRFAEQLRFVQHVRFISNHHSTLQQQHWFEI
jgi:hypothetical protein